MKTSIQFILQSNSEKFLADYPVGISMPHGFSLEQGKRFVKTWLRTESGLKCRPGPFWLVKETTKVTSRTVARFVDPVVFDRLKKEIREGF